MVIAASQTPNPPKGTFKMNFDFQDKVAVVTGAASGIGAAIAKELATNGAKLVVTDMNLQCAEEVAAEVIAVGGIGKAFEVNDAYPVAVEGMLDADFAS